MEGEVPQITIERADLEALAKLNPLAWEQLLHIAERRVLKGRIAELENGTVDHELVHG